MIQPIRPQEVYSLLQQMIAHPADQVRLSSQLRSMVQNLPPPFSELVSRYQFDRAGSWTYPANFFEVGDREPVPQVIRIPHDSWIRGVQAFALTRIAEPENGATRLQMTSQRNAIADRTGSGMRGLFEVNWRINSRQGFISTGTGEILAPAALVGGDGAYSAPLDWRLQQEDTIEVRVRNRIEAIFGNTETVLDTTIPWVAVCFWAEELPEPK
jgi:hypothetical protein